VGWRGGTPEPVGPLVNVSPDDLGMLATPVGIGTPLRTEPRASTALIAPRGIATDSDRLITPFIPPRRTQEECLTRFRAIPLSRVRLGSQLPAMP
jgi:hypothetical protein